MKTYLTLLLLFCSSIIFSQEIVQLDSIQYTYLDDNEKNTVSFEYNDDNLLTKINNFDSEIGIDFQYNEDNKISQFSIDEDYYYGLYYDFKYDSEGQLDTILLVSDDYDYETYIDIEAENDQILRSVIISDYGSYQYAESFTVFRYTDSGKLDSIIAYDQEETASDIEYIWNYEYEDDRLIKRTLSDPNEPLQVVADTIGYNADNTIAYVDRILGEGNYGNFVLEYTDVSTFNEDEFTGPFEFYDIIFKVFEYEISEILFADQTNNLPLSHTNDLSYGSVEGQWFYSITVGNNETKIPAQAISIFPNPSSDFITIDHEYNVTSVEIYSMDGVLALSTQSTASTVDIRTLIAGSYLILVKSDDGKNYFSQLQKN